MLNKTIIIAGFIIASLVGLVVGFTLVKHPQPQPKAAFSTIEEQCQLIGGTAADEHGQCQVGSMPRVVNLTVTPGQGTLQQQQNIVCCIPLTPTPTLPRPTVTRTPTLSLCNQVVAPVQQNDCNLTPACAFSLNVDYHTRTVIVRPEFAEGVFDFEASASASQTIASLRQQKEFTYTRPGIYNIRFNCSSTQQHIAGTCTQRVTMDDNVCPSPTIEPSPTPTTTPSPSPSIEPGISITVTPTLAPTGTPLPTAPVCRLPIPRLEFETPQGFLPR